MIYLSNAFSLSMLTNIDLSRNKIEISRFFDERAKGEIYSAEQKVIAYIGYEKFESVVGHEDTAALFSSELGTDIQANRISISLKEGDRLIVGQYMGPRLPEGCSELPKGATISWYLITIQ